MAASSSTLPNPMTLQICPAGPVSPTGFGVGWLADMMVGANALPSTHPARPVPAAQATGRHRREGRLPDGNSSSTKTPSPSPNSHTQPSQLASVLVCGKWASTRVNPPAA